MKRPVGAALALLAHAACAGTPAAADVGWPMPGGGPSQAHFSTLKNIDVHNVQRLELAWSADLGTTRGLEATPVVIGDRMYTSGVGGRAYAFDAATGRPIWAFRPVIDMQVNRATCCDMVNRGVAVVGGRVFVAAIDGKLYALSADDGHVLWSADTIADHSRGYSSTGAPEIAGGLVLIGNAGADADALGYLTAYDLVTGKQAWRFYPVQDGPSHPSGGAPWNAIVYDAAFDAVYIGTGNGNPYDYHLRDDAHVDGRYLSAVVALDRATGRVKWSFQETPNDSWDYDGCEPIILSDLAVGGVSRKVLIHAPKNGFLFVLDRRDGKLIAAPKLTEPNWASGFDLATGKPHLTPEHTDYHNGPRIIYPASPGARNWEPAAYDAAAGLMYASILDMGNLMFTLPAPAALRARVTNPGAALIFTGDLVAALPTLPPPLRAAVQALPEMARVRAAPFTSELRAIEPLTGKAVWRTKLRGWQDRGGVLATAGGLVFQGSIDGSFNAYAARDGRKLARIGTGVAIMAAPMTYTVAGVQYVAVMAGWGGGGWPYVPGYSATAARGPLDRLFVFRLDGGRLALPPLLPPLVPADAPPPPLPGTTAAQIAAGQSLFRGNCGLCHANQPRSVTPDLRRMAPGIHAAFQAIVRGGLLVSAGMRRWDDLLSAADVDAIHAYLIDQQGRLRVRELALQRAGLPLDSSSALLLSSY